MGGHLSIKVPYVEVESWITWTRISVGAGMACAFKMNNEFKVVVILSDAELYEGSVWEALIFISHHKLVNLIIILDRNYQVVMNKTRFFKIRTLG